MRLRSCIILTGILVAAATTTRAHFDLSNLSRALDKAKEVTDSAKDAGKVAKGVAGIGPEEEKIIGDSVALEIIGRYGGLVRDEDVVRRVNFVGRALTRYSERPDSAWRFGVLNSDSVNAFSAPDGYVFITRGLYAQAPTDDLLAGILAHEIAHITGRHALKIIERNGAVVGGVTLATKYNSDVRQVQSQVNQVDSQLQQFGPGIKGVFKTIVVDGYDAKTEYAADQTGHDLAKLTGFAPGGLRTVLTRLQQTGGDAQRIFSTHPPLKERIKRLPEEPTS